MRARTHTHMHMPGDERAAERRHAQHPPGAEGRGAAPGVHAPAGHRQVRAAHGAVALGERGERPGAACPPCFPLFWELRPLKAVKQEK